MKGQEAPKEEYQKVKKGINESMRYNVNLRATVTPIEKSRG
jgi:hypothetical protein